MRTKFIMAILMAITLINTTYGETITVSAASSLKDVMTELKKEYEKEHTDDLMINFGSSGSLQHQIENGAPVDVFISASSGKMDVLEKQGLLMKNSRRDLLENEVVLVVPVDSKAGLKSYKGLASNNKIKQIGLGEPKSVPAGQYGAEVLDYVGISKRIGKKMVYGKNVRVILSWVETGNVDAGIVYKTDAALSKKVKVIADAPAGSHKPITYPAAIIGESKLKSQSAKFLRFLKSERARSIFEKYGFSPID